jgi:hypothetical protein
VRECVAIARDHAVNRVVHTCSMCHVGTLALAHMGASMTICMCCCAGARVVYRIDSHPSLPSSTPSSTPCACSQDGAHQRAQRRAEVYL